MPLIEECCFNDTRDYCRARWLQPCACGCHTEDAASSASVNYRTRDWDKQTTEGTVVSHILRIPELGNAELKLTVDVERIQNAWSALESLADAPAALPGFAQLRPVRVDIHLGGEHVYHWARDMVVAEEPERVQTIEANRALKQQIADDLARAGASPAKRR